MSLRRFGLAAICAAMLVCTAGLGTAAAAPYGTQVEIESGGPKGAEGEVTSGQPKCLRGRSVTLYMVDTATGGLVEIAKTVTDANGNWEIEVDLFAGEYVVKVDSKPVKAKGKRRSCRSARSLRTQL